MLVVDFDRSPYTPDTVPDRAWVPLGRAHLIVGRSRVTVYRWVSEDRLQAIEHGANNRALKLHVRAGDVREIDARMRRPGHAATRRAATETMR